MVECRLCHAGDTRLLTCEGDWRILECSACGFVFVTPLPDEEYLRVHYQQYLPADDTGINRWQNLMTDVFQRSLDCIERNLPEHTGRKLLDVGCGYGFFLETASHSGFEVRGVEPCVHARSYALKLGFNVDQGGLQHQQYSDNSFDVVTMFYVLEHVREPLSYLKEARRILKPGGVLLIRVPHTTPVVKCLNLLGIRNRLYDAPSHLSDFSPRTIALALMQAGFPAGRTVPGGATRPYPFGQRLVSFIGGCLADGLYFISAGHWLLPGVSKTTITIKKPECLAKQP